ncbi:hypothetical protein A9Q89_00050 [Gammaproteobacteria bacterium 53_120_T64]|nr:hypothetical protein A9Q89_00050 [Gammaproteobacteria bacterium 53_120_T64]
MSVQLPPLIAIACYLFAFALQVRASLQASDNPVASSRGIILGLSGLALVAHFVTSWQQIFTALGTDFSLLPLSVAISLVINGMVIGGSLRRPLHSLFLLLFPLSALALALSLLPIWQSPPRNSLPLGLSLHILLSIIAYSLLSIATLEALFLSYQNRQLHQHHSSALMRILPPLQTMESLLFSLLITGFTLLTLALVSGLFFVDNFFAQHLVHKTVFSIVAWLLYATLLWGHFRWGWRGKTATLWTLGGFGSLMLAFWGSKFVLEVILA